MHACCLSLLLAACSTFHAVPPRTSGTPSAQVRAAQAVRIRFAEPRSLGAVGSAGDTITMASVAGIRGRLLAVRGDTLYLSADDVLDVSGSRHRWRRTDGVPRRVAVVPDPADQLATSRVHAGHAIFGVMVGVAALAAGAVLVFLLTFEGS
jgi:hypothetical protein